jgi:heat shock 70kDa protein 1/2/6/8
MALKPINKIIKYADITKNDIDDVILVGGSTRIPRLQELILNYFKKTKITQLTCTINPDEVVSMGAAIYGYILSHNNNPFSEGLSLLDITPLSLGVETLKSQMTTIIPRGSTIPTKKIKYFSLDEDDIDSVMIKIFEGERKLTKNNFHVGTFKLSGFDKGPRGYPKIKVVFDVDINGILRVSAKEMHSDVKNSIQITSTWSAKGRMSTTEIDNLVEDAKKNEELDMIYSAKIGLIYKIRTMCDILKINLKDKSFGLTKKDKKNIAHFIKKTYKFLDDTELIDLSLTDLKDCKKNMSKKYSFLVHRMNKNNENFTDYSEDIVQASINNDDEEEKEISYCKYDDSSDFDKQEIRSLKSTITSLCRDILNIVNNPICKFSVEDIDIVNSWIDSVTIWSYITEEDTSIKFIAKIKEINDFTEDIMKKYTNIFHDDKNFDTKNELQIMCITLLNSLESKFIYLTEEESEQLRKKVDDNLVWLIDNDDSETIDVECQIRIDELNDICNTIFQSNSRFDDDVKEDETERNETEDDETEEDEIEKEDSVEQDELDEKFKIKEDIDSLINALPDVVKKNDEKILLKIDINKLTKPHNLRYKNITYYSR